MISKREDVGIKHLNVSKAFTEYSQCMDDVYNNIDDYNRSRKRKNLIVLCLMLWLQIFSVPKEVRLNSTHYLIMKIHNKKELQHIATNYSADIDYKDFMKIYRKCASEPYSFLTIDNTWHADNPLRLIKNILIPV